MILSAAVLDNQQNILIARHFIQAEKSRFENLYSQFSKLFRSSNRSNYYENDVARYLVQVLDNVLLIVLTTKTSNILVDLQVQQMFSKLLAETCGDVTVQSVVECTFEIIDFLDEIVSCGYREPVTFAQVSTYVEMKSHEENLFEIMQKQKLRDAEKEMKRKMKEIDQAKSSGTFNANQANMFNKNSSALINNTPINVASAPQVNFTPSAQNATASTPSKVNTMKLSVKNKESNEISQIMKETKFTALNSTTSSINTKQGEPKTALIEEALYINQHQSNPSQMDIPSGHLSKYECRDLQDIHVKIAEQARMQIDRHTMKVSSIESMGTINLRITDTQKSKLAIRMDSPLVDQIAFKTHPRIDDKLWTNGLILGLQDTAKSFPINQDQMLVKFRQDTTTTNRKLSDTLPLNITIWVDNDEVTIDLELTDLNVELSNCTMIIPCHAAPSFITADIGLYVYNEEEKYITWTLDHISRTVPKSIIEIKLNSVPNQPLQSEDVYFPIVCKFHASHTSLAKLEIMEIYDAESKTNYVYSKEMSITVEELSIN